MRAFAYERPTDLAAPSPSSAGHGPDARLLAGGTDLIIRLRDGSIQPRVVVDLKRHRRAQWGDPGDGRPADHRGEDDDDDIAADGRVRRDFQALAEAAAVVGSVQIRNRATLAGNICNASPAADTAPALLVYDAVVVATGPGWVATHPDRRLLRPLRRHDARRRASWSAPSSCRSRRSGAAPSTSDGLAAAATTSPP